MTNIYAHTPAKPSIYPPYISVNLTEEGNINISVRNMPDESPWGPRIGTVSSINITVEEAKQLAENILKDC